jgi:hypothetical protein
VLLGVCIPELVAACPQLRQLWLTVQPNPAVGPTSARRFASPDAPIGPLVSAACAAVAAEVCALAPLAPTLTELQLRGAAVIDAVASGALCQLRQLRRLDLADCLDFTDAGVPCWCVGAASSAAPAPLGRCRHASVHGPAHPAHPAHPVSVCCSIASRRARAHAHAHQAWRG